MRTGGKGEKRRRGEIKKEERSRGEQRRRG